MLQLRTRLARFTQRGPAAELTPEERIYAASQWTLMWRKFRKHPLGLVGITILGFLYTVAVFCQFLAARPTALRSEYLFMAPTPLQFVDEAGQFHLRPFVYGVKATFDTKKLERAFVVDKSKVYPIKFFVQGEPYKLWGVIPTDRRLFGVDQGGALFLMGTDELGRDLYSRLVYGSAISLSIGFVGVSISFILGCIIGGISGLRGGLADLVIQRIVEFVDGIPGLPLWITLSAAVPRTWSDIQVYVAITSILALYSWTGLARTVRSKLLQVREEDFVMAAQIAGASDSRIIGKHLLPSFMSYLIVAVTGAVPGMIMGETAMSFLGLGLIPPTVSWGVLLQDAMNIRTVAINPWMMSPVAFVILAVVAFNFAGDALRDAADPYQAR